MDKFDNCKNLWELFLCVPWDTQIYPNVTGGYTLIYEEPHLVESRRQIVLENWGELIKHCRKVFGKRPPSPDLIDDRIEQQWMEWNDSDNS